MPGSFQRLQFLLYPSNNLFIISHCTQQKLLSVGIQLLLNDPPNATEHSGPRLNRSGKMFLRFREAATPDGLGRFEQPRLLWTDGKGVSYALPLLDIQSIRRPTPRELDNSYPFAIPAHSFLLSTRRDGEGDEGDGHRSLLFEAVDEVQMTRVMTALRGIIGKLARKIIMGENDWLAQMMQAASLGSKGSDAVPCAMTNVTDHIVTQTALMKKAHRRKNQLQSTKTRQIVR